MLLFKVQKSLTSVFFYFLFLNSFNQSKASTFNLYLPFYFALLVFIACEVDLLRRYETNNNEFYHSKEWRILRVRALQRDNYLCQECLKNGVITPASTVHHIKPLRIDSDEALKLENLETVCPKCHNRLHPERGQALKRKKANIRNAKSKNIIVFHSNSERW